MSVPRLVIAGLSGDSGKTLISLALVSALKSRGLKVTAFKKGPDFIDPAWLCWVSGSVCRNLDTFLMPRERLLSHFFESAAVSDIAVVEGNRGLFDGFDAKGSHSTAALARLLGAPVVLVVSARKTTRTLAALVKGCCEFESDLNVAGVVVNHVAGIRHGKIIEEALKSETGCRVLGLVPRLASDKLVPNRHLGLVTPDEFEAKASFRQGLEEVAEHLNIEGLISTAQGGLEPKAFPCASRLPASHSRARIAFFRDSVFTFYYPENLEALEHAGAQLVPVSSLEDRRLPDVHGLYIGGGFPETQANRLGANRELMSAICKASRDGMPIYAECGGLIYLCRSLVQAGQTVRMCGVFDLDLEMRTKPVGHGYARVDVVRENPFYPVGSSWVGHEFHYSTPICRADAHGILSMDRGVGLGSGVDGLLESNTFACYTHLHVFSFPSWAQAMVDLAEKFARLNSAMPPIRLAGGRKACDGHEEPIFL